MRILQRSQFGGADLSDHRVTAVLQDATSGAAAAGQQNTIDIEQNYTPNAANRTGHSVALASQVGIDNDLDIVQTGVEQVIGDVTQRGNSNTASINQLPVPGQTTTNIAGGRNDPNLNVVQDVEQIGDLNQLTIEQEGRGNFLGSVQQLGNLNTALIDVLGSDNNASTVGGFGGDALGIGLTPGNILQSGEGNDLTHTVTGDSNLFAFSQTGNTNTITGSQTGDSNQVAAIQVGNGNTSSFNQVGTFNNLGVSQ